MYRACRSPPPPPPPPFQEEPGEPFQRASNHISKFRPLGRDRRVASLFTHGGWRRPQPLRAFDRGGPTMPAILPWRSPTVSFPPGDKRAAHRLCGHESSLEVTEAPGSKVKRITARIAARSDAKQRSLLVEATGGPNWYADYSVLTGLTDAPSGALHVPRPRIAAEGSSADCRARLQRMRLQDLHAYPERGRLPERPSFPETCGDRSLRRTLVRWAPEDIEPIDLFRSVRARERAEREGGTTAGEEESERNKQKIRSVDETPSGRTAKAGSGRHRQPRKGSPNISDGRR